MAKRSRPMQWLEDTPISTRRQLREELICCMPRCTNDRYGDYHQPLCEFHLITIHGAIEMRGGLDQFPQHRAEQEQRREQYRLAGIHFCDGNCNHEAKKPARPTDGVVYYLRSGGYIKIGWTSDLAKRMRSYAPDSILLATEPGTRQDEQKRHRMFAVHRTHGREWYAMVPALMHHIGRVTETHGTPDPVAFAAKPVEVPRPHGMKPTAKPRPARRLVS